MAGQASIIVTQFCNPKYDENQPKNSETNPEKIYYVERTVNTLCVTLGRRTEMKTRVVDLIQCHNEGQNMNTDPDGYVYQVKSLKNLTFPVVGTHISRSEVERLIGSGIEVNIGLRTY